MTKTKQESLKFKFLKVNSAFLSFVLLEKIEGKNENERARWTLLVLCSFIQKFEFEYIYVKI